MISNRKLLDRYQTVKPISFDRYRYILACTAKPRDLSLIILHFLIILFLFTSRLSMWYLKKCARIHAPCLEDSNVKENVNIFTCHLKVLVCFEDHDILSHKPNLNEKLLINFAYQKEFLRGMLRNYLGLSLST